jgi:mannan endo-1,4-beta-mannosidase
MKRIPNVLWFMLIFSVLPGACLLSDDNGKISNITYDIDGLTVSANAKKILKYLVALSSDEEQGAIAGQYCGHGSQIGDAANTLMGFESLVEGLKTVAGKYVGILGVDYEHDKIFTPDELSECNQVLLDYWNAGGLITINWSPLNPWLNDESDLNNNPGSWTDTRNVGNNLQNVDLRKLVNPAEPIRTVWLRKLDRIAAALLELKTAGVVVLWRPMQEMNGNWFWWGYAKHPDDPSAYKNLFIDMYEYFTNVKGLNNLIWVYSPASAGNKSFSWAYPGGAYVNIVAATAYNDALSISCYDEMRKFNRPMAMAEYGGYDNPTTAASGSFDNRKYSEKIRGSYPMIAYFVCWHNWDNGGGKYVYHSISKNAHQNELMNNADIITRDELDWTSY